MQKEPWRGRRLAVLVMCVVAAFAATAIVLSVSIAATSAGTSSSSKSKAKSKSQTLTKAEVVSLIKKYSKPGSSGATGPAGTTGAGGAKGESGAKGENGAKGETGIKGEDGAKGENGVKGENGTNGAVAGYSVSQPPTGPGEGLSFTAGTAGSPTTVLTKALPAGSYVASAKVEVTLVATDPGGEGDVNCALVDIPASGSPVLDVAGFFAPTAAAVPIFNVYAAATTLPMGVAVSTTGPSTLAINCWVNVGNGGENAKNEPGVFSAEAGEAHIQAVQTNSNS